MNNLEVCQQCLEPHKLCECKRQQVSNASNTDSNSVGELIGDGLELALDVVTFLPRKAKETFESGMGGDFGGAGAGGMWESVTGAAGKAVEVAGQGGSALLEGAGTVISGTAEAAGSVLGGTVEVAGAVLEGAGSVVGGVAEAAGDILGGL